MTQKSCELSVALLSFFPLKNICSGKWSRFGRINSSTQQFCTVSKMTRGRGGIKLRSNLVVETPNPKEARISSPSQHNKQYYHTLSSLKQLTFVTSWFLWLGHGLAGSSASGSHRAAISLVAGSEISCEGPTGAEPAPKLVWLVGGFKPLWLMGCQTEGLRFSLAVGQQLLSDPCTWAWDLPPPSPPSMAIVFIRASKGRQSVSKTDTMVLCTVIMGVTSCHLCSILLGRSHRFCPHSRGDCTMTQVPGGKDNLGPS